MKQIVCEMCGGKELIKQDGVFVCQNCGSKYSIEEAKKMMVTIDTSAKLENALKNARRAKECNDYKQAEKYYGIVQMEEPENWEANFYSTYCKAIGTSISQATNSIANVIKSVLKDIKKLDDNTQQNEAIKQMSIDLVNLVSVSYNNAINGYNALSTRDRVTLKENHNIDILNLVSMLKLFENELVSEFGKNEFTTSINIQCYETALKITNSKYFADELAKINPTSHELAIFFYKGKVNRNNNLKGCGILLLISIFIGFFIALNETKSQKQNTPNKELLDTARYLYGGLENAYTISNSGCTGRPIQLYGSIENIGVGYIDIKPNIRVFFSSGEFTREKLRINGQIRLGGECKGREGNKIIIHDAVIVDYAYGKDIKIH